MAYPKNPFVIEDEDYPPIGTVMRLSFPGSRSAPTGAMVEVIAKDDPRYLEKFPSGRDTISVAVMHLDDKHLAYPSGYINGYGLNSLKPVDTCPKCEKSYVPIDDYLCGQCRRGY